MPIGFVDDPDGSRYRAAYFEYFTTETGGAVWRHGDWVERTEDGGWVVHGRSDTTLNPGGVRIGTSEIYRQVETLDEVMDAVVIGQQWAGDLRVVLFVVLGDGLTLDDALRDRIRTRIREGTTPRHVPALVLQVPDVPRTVSGKVSEVAVRRAVHGQSVPNRTTLANPESIRHFVDLPELAAAE
jgi:acetoacetyl-CoA synthetase